VVLVKSAPVAESAVARRLRPLYATAFLHSFVLWYSVEKLFMRSVGLDDYLITLATLVYIVVMMVANVPLGLLADRWSRKGVLYLATCALIGSSLVCGFSGGLGVYATGISVWGLFYAAYAGTYDSAVYDVVLEETGSAEGFERCYGRVQMFEATAFITSALLSAAVARYFSLRVEYFLTIPFSCAAFLTLARFREPGLHRAAARVHLAAHLGQIVRGATAGRAGWIVLALVANCVVMRLLIEFYQLWYLGLALPVLWYGPACALMYCGAWGGGALASRLAGRRTVQAAGAATLVIAFGLFTPSPRLVIAAQVATIFGITVLNIALTRYLHDTMPSTVRAGASSVVSTIGYATFVPTALGFGHYSHTHGILAASVFIVAPLAVICVAVACARRGRTEPAPQPVQQPIEQLLALGRLQQSHRVIAPGTLADPGRPRHARDVPSAPYWWPADRPRQPAAAGPKVNRVGEPAKSLASRAWQRPGRPEEGAGNARAGSAARGQPPRADHDRPGPVPLGAPVSAGPVPGLAATPAVGGQAPEWREGDGQEWGRPGVGDGEERDGGEQVLAGTSGLGPRLSATQAAPGPVSPGGAPGAGPRTVAWQSWRRRSSRRCLRPLSWCSRH
jgi:MFS family permease